MAVVHSLEDIEQMPKTKYTSEACNYWIQTNWVYNLKIVHREKKLKVQEGKFLSSLGF